MAANPRRPLIAGNWKMNGLRGSIGELRKIIEGASQIARADFLVCPPATLVAAFAEAARGSVVAIGGQDCHTEPAGAFTGDISAEMLADAGAKAVILGHSERRTLHQESDMLVSGKVRAAWRAGLIAIVCIGETRAERQAGRTLDVIRGQLRGSVPDGPETAKLVIAYEPVWAIGTGLTPTVADVADVHRFVRQQMVSRFGASGEGVRVLYGGSVKPSNAGDLLGVENVDGALVGGASLKAEEFLAIASVYRGGR